MHGASVAADACTDRARRLQRAPCYGFAVLYWHEIRDRPAIEGLAYLADASAEDCMTRGARWTLVRSVERGRAMEAILVFRRLGEIQNGFIGYGKALVAWANAERAGALGDAIDRNDAAAAVTVLDEWVSWEHEINVRVVAGLLQAFSTRPAK